MQTFIYKKIIKISNQISDFVRENLVQLAIIGGLFVFLEIIQTFPYINIIPNYQFLVIGFMLFLTVVLLKVSVSNRKIISAVLILFLFTPILEIFDIKRVSDLIGFVAFILLTIVIIRQIVIDREKLKKMDLE
jgi:hypothetical protein